MSSSPNHSTTAAPGSIIGAKPGRAPLTSMLPTRMRCSGALAVLAALSVFAVATDQFLGGSHDLDRALLFGSAAPFDHAGPIGSKRLADLAWSFTALGSPELVALLTAAATGFLVFSRKYRVALFVCATVGSGTAFAYLLKRIFGSLRPHHAPGEMIETVFNTSFPSGHAMLAALLYGSLATLVPSIAPRNRLLSYYAAALAIGLTGGVGLSRLFLGLHWPSDVAAGWVAGALWVALCYSGLHTSKLDDQP